MLCTIDWILHTSLQQQQPKKKCFSFTILVLSFVQSGMHTFEVQWLWVPQWQWMTSSSASSHQPAKKRRRRRRKENPQKNHSITNIFYIKWNEKCRKLPHNMSYAISLLGNQCRCIPFQKWFAHMWHMCMERHFPYECRGFWCRFMDKSVADIWQTYSFLLWFCVCWVKLFI